MRRIAAALCAGMWLGACDGAVSADAFCELGAEHEVARTPAKDFDAIALTAFDGGAVAFWSVAGGLFAQALDANGAPRGGEVRIGERCAGGLDAVADGAAIELACLVHPTRGKHHEPGGVLLHRVDSALRVQRSRLFGSAGAQSEGVALARGPGGLELAWHDGSPDAHRVLWAEPLSAGAAPRAVSQPGRMAQAPDLLSAGGRTVLTWAENWIERGELTSRIAAWDKAGAARTLVPRAHVAAMPQLFARDGQLGLAFRDRASAAEKTGLYLAALDPAARRASAPVRAGRADGVGRPAIAPCMDGFVAATPRTYGGDYFVGVNWLDRDLARTRGEQQFYEDSHAFTQVAAACLGRHALLLIAEFPQLQRDSTALRAVPYTCR